jgi:hypothetical protein
VRDWIGGSAMDSCMFLPAGLMRGNGSGDVERMAARASVSDDGRREWECCDIDALQRPIHPRDNRLRGLVVVVVVVVVQSASRPNKREPRLPFRWPRALRN